MSRYAGLTLRIAGQDGSGNLPAMGPGKAKLLERIGATGSISAAARDLGMSYRRAWQLVDAINQSFAEPLVVTETGGKRGGGAHVTPLGEEVLRRYRKMEHKASLAIAPDLERFTGLMRKRRRR